MATRKGLEPSTSSVTGWHSNQLNYRARRVLFYTEGAKKSTGDLGLRISLQRGHASSIP